MADRIKVLGQVASSAATAELYTVPTTFQTTTSSLVICNRTTGSIAYRVSVHINGADAADEQYLYYDTPLAANATFSAVLGLTLSEGDVVNVYAPIGISFNLFGIETG
jgi:hypothetical protein